MKTLLILLTFLTAQAFGQTLERRLGEPFIARNGDCGYLVKDTTIIEITSTDTIGVYHPGADTMWTYSGWENTHYGMTYAVYCPCGCNYPTVEVCERVNNTGVHQLLKKVTTFKYTEAPKSAYDLKIDSLKNRK